MRITTVMLLALISALCFTHRLRADDDAKPAPYDWKSLDPVVGIKGELKDDVYTYTIPRDDLNVSIDAMDVPPGVGIASEFHFFKCSCGKIRLVGEFCCADYEVNDVIDAIRPGAMLEVSNVGPMFLHDKPRVIIVRFQGEGDAPAMAKLLKSALGWMGEARNATQPMR